jgi:hypothetical protein
MSEQPSTFDITGGTTTLVTELVGEGKKFKSVEDLAKGKLESDTFIEKLKTENAALREALDSEGGPDEVLKRINELLRSKTGSENATATKGNQATSESLTEEKVLELLSKREREEKLKGNVSTFNSNVTKAFGAKAAEVVATRLDELGMDQASLSDLASKNPNAALRLLGIKESGVSGGAMEASVNTEAYFGPAGQGNGEKQNFAYFQKMRRELGMKYYEPHIQKQVFESRKKLGTDFWKQ